MSTTITIKPVLTVNNKDTTIYPVNDTIKVPNNYFVTLDLSAIGYQYYLEDDNVVDIGFRPTKIIVDWGDDKVDTFNYQLVLPTEVNWLVKIQEWLTTLGPHQYNLNLTKDTNKNINVIIVDSSDNKFTFNIQLLILSQSIYNLDFELNIKKTVFNSEVASAIFLLDSTDNSLIEKSNCPIISILK